MMWNKVRIAGAASANSILRKVVTTAVAFGLAASFTLGAAPVSATPTPSYDGWALEALINPTPQWGDEVTFSAEIDWSSCKRIPTVYLLGTADNGDPISEKLTGVHLSGKSYGYVVTYGGVDESGVPYDSELTQEERAALHDRRLPAGWNSFSLMATSTKSNCGFKKIYTDTTVDLFVGPKLDGITLTTSATHEISVDTTAGLVVLTDEGGYDFTSGIYEYEATSQLGDTNSELWFEDGEMVGDTLTVDVNERDDWDGNPSGVNCYIDSEVVVAGDTVVDGHHAVDDADAVDCASIPVDELGEHTLTVERWVDSCNDGCLSWATYTINFARVENQDAVPYSLDLLDASTGASLPDDSFDWSDPTTGNNINLAPDYTNGIEIQSDVPFGADLSCEYDDDGSALTPGDMFQPVLNAGDTYLVCTVTPEDPSAASFTYTVTIHRYSSNVGISSISVYRGEGVALDVTQDPVAYTSDVDYSAGLALYSDDTVGIEVVPQDLETDVTCYRNAGLTHEDDCANFDLNTPYDSTTGAWILLTAEDGSEQDYHLVIEHTTADNNSGLADATNGLQFSDSYTGDGVGGAWSVGECMNLDHRFDGDSALDWCVRQRVEGDWVLYATDDSTASILTTRVSVNSSVECDNNRYPASLTGNCNNRHLASRTDNNDSAVTDGDNNFEVTVTAQGGTTTVYNLYVERIDNNSKLDDLALLNDASVGIDFDSDFSSTDYEYHVDVSGTDLVGGSYAGHGLDVVATLIDSGEQYFRSAPLNECLVGYTDGLEPLDGDYADCNNIVIPDDADDDYVVVVRVFAQNGTHSDYTIYFTYLISDDKTLSDLAASGDRPLTPGYSSDTYSYTAPLGSGTFRVDYTTGSVLATATCVAVYAGEEHDCTGIPTDAGAVVVTVTVTAENGDEQEYVIRFRNGPAPEYVTKAKAGGTLKVGKTINAFVGIWRYQPSYSYLWYSCASDAVSQVVTYSVPANCSSTGVTTRSFKLGSAQLGRKMMVRITGTNENGAIVIYTALTLKVK